MSISVLEKVATQLAANGNTLVQEQVVDNMVMRTVTKRTEAMVKVLDLIDQEEKSLRKIEREDNVTYKADRSVATASYSKARLDEIDKVRKRLKKMTDAVEKALNAKDAGAWGDLFNISAQGKVKDDDDAAKPAEGDRAEG